MRLKVRKKKFSAGRPIAIINESDSKQIGAGVNERIIIKYKSKSIVTPLDLSEKISPKGTVVLSQEVIDYLGLKGGENIGVEIARNPRVIKIINKKLSCKKLSQKEITQVISAIVKNALTETEIAFFISAIYKCGMSIKETEYLTRAIFETGEKLNLKYKKIADKHSIGGIAGNRTTPLVVSICSSAGLIMPKNSSRAITSAAGTADVMEAVCKVEFNKTEMKKIVRETGACLVWGGSLGFAPADDKIIRVERLIQIDPKPNLIASILAKKLSVGSTDILIDIPYGKGAKVNKQKAKELKTKFEKISKTFKMNLQCILTPAKSPIGNGIGPILEIRDIINVLEGGGPKDLKEKSILLSAKILELTKKAKPGKGEALAEELISSGKALEQFKKIVKAQKGNLKNLSLAKFSKDIKAKNYKQIKQINNKNLNLLARIAGSPDDKKAGVYFWKKSNEKIKKGEKIITIYSSSKKRLEDAFDFYKENKVINFK